MRRIKDLFLGIALVLLFTLFDRHLEGNVSDKKQPEWAALLGIVLGVFVGILLASLVDCAHARPYQREVRETVLVVNESLDELAIYAGSQNTRIGTVSSGRRACLYLPMTQNNLRLYARAIGGGIRYSPIFLPSRSWRWTVDMSKTQEALGLMEIEPCK